MSLSRDASLLLDHSPKIGAGIVVVAQYAKAVKALQARCREQQLPVRVVTLEPGSLEEDKFMLMLPASNRERLEGRNWVFCRANPTIVPRQRARP